MKRMIADAENLREYCRCGSEKAFRALVESQGPLVHGVAVRMVRDRVIAAEITQSVFIILAKKALSIPPEHLPGWLHNTAAGECRNVLRKEARRQALNTQYALAMNEKDSGADEWNATIAPHLDEAVARLSHEDRQITLLRYFEQRSFDEIARVLGLSKEACKKRAQRALGRLSKFLKPVEGSPGAKSTAALAAALASLSLLPPSASAAAISKIALGSAGSLASGPPSIFKLIQFMTTKQVTTIAALPAAKFLTFLPPILALSAGAIWTSLQHREINRLENQSIALERSIGKWYSGTNVRSAKTGQAPVSLKAGPINWRAIKAKPSDFIAMEGLRKQLDALAAPDLVTEIENIRKLDDRSDDEKTNLEGLALRAWGEKEPETALNRYAARFNTSLDGAISEVFESWTAKTPGDAVRWLDRQISEGKLETTRLDGYSALRLNMEAPLIRNLLSTDKAAATARFRALPENQRSKLFERIISEVNDGMRQGQAHDDLYGGEPGNDDR